MIKRDELSNPRSCLNKAADDEPVFVFRAQDQTAPMVVEYWLEMNPDLPPEKAQEALAWIAAARMWPGRKMAD